MVPRRKNPLLSAALAGLLAAGAAQATLPRAAAVPGGVISVPLGPAGGPAPIVHLGERRVLVRQAARQWVAVVGLALDIKAGRHVLRVRQGRVESTRPFELKAKKYPTQRLQVSNRRHVDPNAEDLKRIARERALINSAFRQWRAGAVTDFLFRAPVAGRQSSAFGLRRIFNGQARRPHSGLDIAAPRGTPIIAPAAGRISRIGEYFFNGRTVFIDHGQGLITMYAHLSRITRQAGDWLTRGEAFAEVGSSGRVTGPHLHWSVSLNDARVDPALFLRPHAE